jgi:Ras-related GTP-binding protein C/D
LAPHETFFLLPSQQVDTQLINTNDNINFHVVDFPGNYLMKQDLKRHI